MNTKIFKYVFFIVLMGTFIRWYHANSGDVFDDLQKASVDEHINYPMRLPNGLQMDGVEFKRPNITLKYSASDPSKNDAAWQINGRDVHAVVCKSIFNKIDSSKSAQLDLITVTSEFWDFQKKKMLSYISTENHNCKETVITLGGTAQKG